MNRTFRFSPLWILLFFAGGLISCSNQNRGDQKNPALGSRPNIIYILADDLGYGDLGAYGGQQIETPNLDGLSEEGIRFTQHYSGSTVCAPARSVLMTGLHTGHTPIRANREILPIGQHPLPEGTLTSARVLKDAGYATGAFGKWGLGGPESEGLPSLQGLITFLDSLISAGRTSTIPSFSFAI